MDKGWQLLIAVFSVQLLFATEVYIRKELVTNIFNQEIDILGRRRLRIVGLVAALLDIVDTLNIFLLYRLLLT